MCQQQPPSGACVGVEVEGRAGWEGEDSLSRGSLPPRPASEPGPSRGGGSAAAAAAAERRGGRSGCFGGGGGPRARARARARAPEGYSPLPRVTDQELLFLRPPCGCAGRGEGREAEGGVSSGRGGRAGEFAYKLLLSYGGSLYSGWQVQKGPQRDRPTVQLRLEALQTITQAPRGALRSAGRGGARGAGRAGWAGHGGCRGAGHWSRPPKNANLCRRCALDGPFAELKVPCLGKRERDGGDTAGLGGGGRRSLHQGEARPSRGRFQENLGGVLAGGL